MGFQRPHSGILDITALPEGCGFASPSQAGGGLARWASEPLASCTPTATWVKTQKAVVTCVDETKPGGSATLLDDRIRIQNALCALEC